MKTTILYEKRYLYRGWLCRPLIVFYVTVFPSARARHSVPLGRVARFITARAFTLSVPSCRKSALGREAAASLKVTLGKSAILPRSIYTALSLRKGFNYKSVRCFFAILWGRKNTFAIRPNKCKSALRCRNFWTAPLAAVCPKISRALSSLRGLRAHFTFWHTLSCSLIKGVSAKKYHFYLLIKAAY